MESCIRNGGENKYKLAHMSKAKLRREGRLPLSIPCSAHTALVMHAFRSITASAHS
ncbi:hypothetical protein JG687_00015687 [Phytophthora cactorum]|uniref:Uncharacterized protein n=1 Tax=Phytophthora cactorum TaxID=29920 RepID=A0A8T1TSL9_9STRA|nr:hypothetical protein JG687_00015687 [Phytophthora cactorum]